MHQHNGDQPAKNGAEERHLVAHFTSASHAEQALRSLDGSIDSPKITSHEESAFQPASAAMGISTVEIGTSDWLGLAIGIVIGAVLGFLVYTGRLIVPGVAPALSAGPVAVIVLGAGILGSIGWLIEAVIHLARTADQSTQSELHLTVPADKWSDVGEQLVDAGAMDVFIPDNEKPSEQPSMQPDRQHEHGHH